MALVLRTFEFLFYHLLLSGIDRVSRLPRDSTVSEAMRLYREYPGWGQRRIRQELRRMAIRVSEPTIVTILRAPDASQPAWCMTTAPTSVVSSSANCA